jgi:hypothetical protein
LLYVWKLKRELTRAMAAVFDSRTGGGVAVLNPEAIVYDSGLVLPDAARLPP